MHCLCCKKQLARQRQVLGHMKLSDRTLFNCSASTISTPLVHIEKGFMHDPS